MAQINITQTGTSGIATPESGVVAIFANNADNGKLYYKFDDGSIAPVDTGGTSGGAALTVTDGSTTVNNVDKITLSGATVTDDGSGDVTLTISGGSGSSGTSGAAGSSGTSGAGNDGSSGTSGADGSSGTSGAAGSSGTSGVGSSGTSGTTGTSGNGTDGSSGTSGDNGSSGTSGAAGAPGSSGTSGTNAPGITSGSSGTSGAAGAPGDAGSSGTSGTTGTSGNGTDGSSGTSGATGDAGSSGTSGEAGAPGSSGTSGTSAPGLTSGSSGTSGAAGAPGDPGSSGTSGATGNPGSSGTSGTGGGGGAALTVRDGSTTVTDVEDIIFSGGTITSGTSGVAQVTISGGGGGGISTVFSNNIRYLASSGNNRCQVLSTGTLYGGLSWSRSSTTLTVTSTGHGLTTGDYVVIRNMSEDYSYVSITDIDGDSFTCTVADSGGTSGTEGAYIPAFDVTAMSDTALTLEAPSAGNVQLISFTHFIESTENAAITVTVPSNAISNGAGANSAINSKIIPILAGYNVQSSGFAIISGLGLSFSTTANFNQYTVSGGLGYFDRFAYSLHF